MLTDHTAAPKGAKEAAEGLGIDSAASPTSNNCVTGCKLRRSDSQNLDGDTSTVGFRLNPMCQ